MTKATNNEEEPIEKEEGNENIKIEIPFDPNDININIIPRTIGQLVEMLDYNEILVPKFQRLPNLWDLKKKSRFIESLMLNLPIPLFYFDEGDDKKWRVIDGLQRISALEHFILGDKKKDKTVSGNKQSFKLQDLEFRNEYNGKSWNELPKDVQRRIQTNQVTINLIGKGTPEQVKYNIFSRINQGGIELKPQEIRTALFQGYPMDFIESLVSENTKEGQMFLKATDGSVPSKRQEDLDFATRFTTFYLLDYNMYEPDMDSFMTLGTKAIPNNKIEQNKIAKAFLDSMELAFTVFNKDAFRKRKALEDKRKPINKALFEIISVYFAKLSNDQKQKLIANKKKFIDDFTKLQNKEKFWGAITTGTAAKENVKSRHTEFDKLLNKFKQ